MNVRKRGLALLMCICMVFTLLPFSVFAEDAENGSRGVLKVLHSRALSTVSTTTTANGSRSLMQKIPSLTPLTIRGIRLL